MSILIYLFAILGLFVGSFLNVCIDRLPHDQSIVRPPSHCQNCGTRLRVADLIPIVSYIWLRGRCRYCGAPIPLRLPLVEGATGLIFGFFFWKYGLTLEMGMFLVYAALLIVIFVIDLEQGYVLDIITYPALAMAFVFSFFWPGIRTFSVFWPQLGVESALVGAAIGAAVMSLPFILYRGGMGAGDIKLGALLGMMTGFPLIILVILMSWISGGTVALILLVLKIKGRKDSIPFAPFLVTAALITLVWGQLIVQWYF